MKHYSDEWMRLQKKLVPVNIVVVIIALVAAFSLLFAPLITIDFRGREEELEELINRAGEEQTDPNQEEWAEQQSELMVAALSSVNISVTAAEAGKLAMSADPVMDLSVKVAGIIGGAADKLFAGQFLQLAEQAAKDYGSPQVDTDKVYQKIKELETTDDAGKVIDELAGILADGIEGLSATDREDFIASVSEEINKFYNDTVETSGKFTVEAAVCAAYAGGREDVHVTNYAELVYDVLTNRGEADEQGGQSAEALGQSLKAVGAVIFLFTASFAVLWVIQALLAFLHIFTKNKRVLMWYTKLWGFNPCLMFGIAPLLAVKLLPKLMPDAAAIVGLLGSLSTMTWISGACYILLWLVSIFWAHPIKRKIRALEKAGK